MLPESYEPLLAEVEKPGRYVGGEHGSVVKDAAGLRASIALAFPDVYDIGMSYHGFRILYEIVNEREDLAAERVFAPWPDFADALRREGLALRSLETGRALSEFEVVGFTLQHELCYTNVLEMLDLGGITLRAAERDDDEPIVIAGAAGAWSPEPMAAFVDAFVIGDGEESILEILEAVARGREENLRREDMLRRLAEIAGVYVPSLYDVEFDDAGRVAAVKPNANAPETVEGRVFSVADDNRPLRPVVPLIRTVQSRTVIESRRGCVHGCRFCQAGMLTRPVRERGVEQIVEAAKSGIKWAGDDTVSLLGLSTADYSRILPLVRRLNAELAQDHVSVSLPSLRISAFDVELADEVGTVRKSGFTFAPEAGTDRLRRVINKPLDEDDFMEIVGHVLRAGWRTLKFYFMIGLPTETDEDLDGIVRIVNRAMEVAKAEGIRNAQINLTLSPFVPKAHTPFQWEGQITLDEMGRRYSYVRERLPKKGVALKTSPLAGSRLEAVMARGDRRLGEVIEKAWRGGCRFDAWSETFRPNVWWDAMEACGLAPEFYAERQRGDDEVFPYKVLISPPGREWLERERDKAREEAVTEECVNGKCSGCRACKTPKAHALASAMPGGNVDVPPTPKAEKIDGPKPSADAVQRLRLRFTKAGPLRFISHLDLADVLHRLMRLADLSLAYSQGYNPQPKTQIAPPLPLGYEARGEVVDVSLVTKREPEAVLDALRGVTDIEGLEWLGVERVALKAPSLQQAITMYQYDVVWKVLDEEKAVLPTERDAVAKRVGEFMKSESWPIELQRKKKVQKRDAREFVEAIEVMEANEPGGHLAMRMRSKNGATLNPEMILQALFGEGVKGGVVLKVSRLALEI